MTGAVLAASVPSRSRVLGLDLKHRTAKLGYSVAKDLWARGLVPEAAKALIDWGFHGFANREGLRLRRRSEPSVRSRHGEVRDETRGALAQAPPLPR